VDLGNREDCPCDQAIASSVHLIASRVAFCGADHLAIDDDRQSSRLRKQCAPQDSE
jgi:hypothetical protein